MPVDEPNQHLTITQATPAEWLEIAAILEDAQRWLRSRGIPQWTRSFDRAWIEPKIVAGEFYIARLQTHSVAVARLLQSDPLFWGDSPQRGRSSPPGWGRVREREVVHSARGGKSDDGDALYIHSLAVLRAYAGQGIGRQFLDWVADEARRSGRRFLRLDCTAGNRSLCAYYERAGFIPFETVEVGHEAMMLFEKPIA
ncbi:MAG: GNAT family N-acetyltransferase [Thermomicrobiales bacterium]